MTVFFLTLEHYTQEKNEFMKVKSKHLLIKKNYVKKFKD